MRCKLCTYIPCDTNVMGFVSVSNSKQNKVCVFSVCRPQKQVTMKRSRIERKMELTRFWWRWLRTLKILASLSKHLITPFNTFMFSVILSPIPIQLVWFLERVTGPSQGPYLHVITQHKNQEHTHMPRAVFELTISVLEWSKTVRICIARNLWLAC